MQGICALKHDIRERKVDGLGLNRFWLFDICDLKRRSRS